MKAGVTGTVVLNIVIDASGSVQDVGIVSGDPNLAQAASEAVRQWKYKPYVVEGSPAEIETQVTASFHLESRTKPSPPPLGSFGDNTYTNAHFSLYYPFSPEWIRVTELIRKQLANENLAQAPYVLLGVVHIPQDLTQMRADSSFTVLAVNRLPQTVTDNCKQYLDTLGASLHAEKTAKQKGAVNNYTVAGHEFSRADFDYRAGVSDHAMICSPFGDYLLLWNIQGLSWKAVDNAASTIRSIEPWPGPAPKTAAPEAQGPSVPSRVQVAQGVSTGLLIKKVQPIYPPDARMKYIQGTVRMRARISKAGDIEDLELIDGPIELAVSAVNAVRQWKYRPYLIADSPVAVLTEIVVNYTLTR